MFAKTSIADYLLQRIIGSSSYNFKYHLKECLMHLPEEDLRAIAYERNVHVARRNDECRGDPRSGSLRPG